MKRVLFITDNLSKSSGITSVIVNYLSNIDYQRIKIDVLSFGNYDNEIVSRLRSFGAQLYFLPYLRLFTIFKTISELKKFFKNHNFDIVHSHFSQMDSIIFPIAKKYGNVKFNVSHGHSTRYSNSCLKSIRNCLMCLPIRYMADVFAACSELAGIFLFGKNFVYSEKKLIINNAIKVVNYSFNENIRTQYRRELNILDNEIVIGMVGSLRPEKNHCFIINAFAELMKQKPNNFYKLVIVGDGSERKKIEDLINKNRLVDKIILLGARADANNLFQAFDIFVLPSLFEGFPVVGVEAQASGLPCLFSDTITREVGIVDYNYLSLSDISKWVDAIKNVTIKTNKRYLASEVISQKGFNIKIETKKLEDFYVRILS